MATPLKSYRESLRSEMYNLITSGEPFLIVDTETTGLLKDDPSQIIEISIVNQNGEVVFCSLIKADHSIPPALTKFHGITDEDLAEAPTFTTIWPTLLGLLNGVKVYCYNVDFDLGMLRKTAKHYGEMVPPSYRWECVMKRYAAYHGEKGKYGDYKFQSLATACGTLRVSMSEQHRATGDCLSTLAVMKALASLHTT